MPLMASVSSFLSSTGSTYSRLICPKISAISRNWSSGSGPVVFWAVAEICSVASTPATTPIETRLMFLSVLRMRAA